MPSSDAVATDLADGLHLDEPASWVAVPSVSRDGDDPDRLDVLYGLGLRQTGIACSDSNALGSGLAERVDGGFTAFGHRAVRCMDQLGTAVDVSRAPAA
jgi:microsomal dipeptidase-like Zn-dependent dipeptidase